MIIDYPKVHDNNKGTHPWEDVTNHTNLWRSYYFPHDSITTCHECTHCVNNDIRNKHSEKKYNAFYLLNDKALLTEEPNFRKSDIKPFIPNQLRSNRYNLYVNGMNDWADRPLYIWEEFSSYINGAYEAATYQNGSSTDWCMGPLEFSVYSLAVLMATEKYSPKGLDTLRGDFVILWKRGWDAYRKCIKVFPWAAAASYEDNFNNNQEMQHFVEKMALNEEDKPDFSSI